MKVPAEIQKKWKSHYEHGDFAEIKKTKQITALTAKRAIMEGRCSVKTYNKVNEFYLNKVSEIKQIVKQLSEVE